jgi:hypothetical protein
MIPSAGRRRGRDNSGASPPRVLYLATQQLLLSIIKLASPRLRLPEIHMPAEGITAQPSARRSIRSNSSNCGQRSMPIHDVRGETKHSQLHRRSEGGQDRVRPSLGRTRRSASKRNTKCSSGLLCRKAFPR